MWKRLAVIATTAGLLLPAIAFGASYDPNNILSVQAYEDKDAFGEQDIQRFLETKGSGLASLAVTVGEQVKKISTLFFEAAQSYRISPKLLLATAQKEQSAVTDGTLSQWQQDALMGYGVYPGSGSPYLGIDKQIDGAAWQFRRYVDKPENFAYQVGQTKTTGDNYEVTPANQSTAGLYNYTPHAGAPAGSTENDTGAGGNFLFWKTWQSWFAAKHPNGTLIRKEGEPGVFQLVDGKKRGFWSRQAFTERFKDSQVVLVTQEELDSYGERTPMTFPDGTLLRAPNGAIFVIERGKRRGITSRTLFEAMGYNFAQAIPATQVDLDIHPEGTLYLEAQQRHPDGALVKAPDELGVFLMYHGTRRPIRFREVFDTQFSWKNVITISKERLRDYPVGTEVRFRDGTLVRDQKNGAVYAIENGKRRKFVSEDALARLGYNPANVILAPHEAVLLHARGEDLDVF